jgi:cell division protein FtsB
MDKLNIFLPITKVDVMKRLVSGCLTAEVVDKANEIMDYESGKPQFQKWSDEFAKNTNGKSLGNVRAMHGKNAVGKFTEINFDDASKSISGTAKIVDDAEWEKVVEGVYTGFSIGGKYLKRWEDPRNPDIMRFTPEPCEVSIVDNPCVAEAVFELIRADGSTEMMKFKQPEPAKTPAKTIPAPEQVWKANDGSTYAKKEDALKKNAELQAQQDKDPVLEILDKVNAAVDALEIEPMNLGKRDFSDDERKKLAESGAAMSDGSFPITDTQDLKNAIHAFGRAKDKAKAKAHIIARAKALDQTGLLPANWHKEGKGDHKDDGSEGNKFAGVKLKKGLHEVARGACLIQELEWLCTQIEWEQASENDTESTQPDELKHIITTLCSWLQDAVEEECREIVEPHAVDLMEMAAGLPEDHAMALNKVFPAEAYNDKPNVKKLVKELAKAGARHSKADSAKLSELHDKIGEMGDHLGKLAEAHGDIEEAHDDIKSDHRAMGKCMGKAADGKMDDMKEIHSEMGEHIKKAKEAHGKAEDVHSDMEGTHSDMQECMKCLMSADKTVPTDMQKNTEELDLLKADVSKKDETIKKLTDGLDALAKRLKVIESQPLPAKGVLYAVPKGHEVNSGNDLIEATPSEPDRRSYAQRI